MFQGHANINLDDKGRIIIPSKFRKHISSEANSLMHVTLGRDNCLWLYPSNEWTKLVKRLLKLNAYTKDVIAMQRQILYFAEECSIDSQHRILIPQNLLQKVEIKKEILIIGQLDRIELWNQKTYEKYLKENKETYEDVMDKVMSSASLGDENV
ncbi:MAG: division/cell wall cluster transcriptional repressor MraZ [Ignavibacteria bacterium]